MVIASGFHLYLDSSFDLGSGLLVRCAFHQGGCCHFVIVDVVLSGLELEWGWDTGTLVSLTLEGAGRRRLVQQSH